MQFLFLLLGGLISFIATYIFHRYKTDALSSENNQIKTGQKVLEEKHSALEKELQAANTKLAEETNKILDLTKELAVKDTNLKNFEERNAEYKKEVEAIQSKFGAEFKNLANEILDDKSKKFTDLNKTNIEAILKPLNDNIINFEKKVNDTYEKEARERVSLGKEVENLVKANQKISEDANNLTNALKGQTKTQGQWGEFILNEILEHSGLAKDREYFIQESYIDEGGHRKQPDVIVKYPGDKTVIIDSKVSLIAYERYSSAESEDQRKFALREHLTSIRKHIDELDLKKYSELYQIRTLDFVIMFIPIEPAFLVALQNDQQVWSYAYDRRILLLSPTNLIACLMIIYSLWQQDNQSKNVLEIARQSGELYDKFVGFIDDLRDIGNKLNSTQKSYDGAFNKLKDGKGNLITRAENIKKL